MKPTTLLAAVLILLLAAFLRFHLLDAQSFWNDEGNSARLSERPIGLIIEGTASDVHPPLYYLLLHVWRSGAGASEFSLRAFSVLSGVLTVAFTLALARSISRWPLAVFLVAGLLAAVSPPLVYYAQETRMYALLALLAVLSTWALWQWIAGQSSASTRSSRLWLVVYSLSILAGLYTHYFFPAIILAQGSLVAIYLIAPQTVFNLDRSVSNRRLPTALKWGGAVLIAGLGYAVWVPIFLRQIGTRGGPAQTLLEYLSNSGMWLAVGTTLPRPAATWALLSALALVVMGLVIRRRRAIVPLVMAAVPIGGSFLVGATDPAFFKFLLTAVPFLCILAALAWRRMDWPRVGAAALTIIYVVTSLASLTNMYTDPANARTDYRGIVARIAAESHPNAAIILNAPNQWEVFTYYHTDGAPVFPLPLGAPNPAEVEPALAEIAANHERLYVLFWGDAQRDPEHIVERWLDANTFKTAEEWVGDVRFMTYATLAADKEVELTPASYDFETADGNTITLEAFRFQPQQLPPGEIIQVRLQWAADGPTAQPIKVFMHLIDENGNLVAQRDSEPSGGTRPTTGWAAGETILDNYGIQIPPDAASGPYRLVIGLYDAYDPSVRLPVLVDGITRDSVELGSVLIR